MTSKKELDTEIMVMAERNIEDAIIMRKRIRKFWHRILVLKYKKVLKWMDFLVILIVLMNLGALGMTDFMVNKEVLQDAEKNNKTIEYVEANPVMADLHGYKKSTLNVTISILGMLLKQVVIWALLIGIYLGYRLTFFKSRTLFFMAIIISFYFLAIGSDFIHDLALLLSALRYG